MGGKLLLSISLVVSSIGLASLTCQIENIEISASNTSATIKWDMSDDCQRLQIFKYEVQWQHVKYDACDSNIVKDEANFGSVDVPAPSTIAKTEENLHPYSTYDLFIKVTTGNFQRINGSGSFKTLAGVPGRNEEFEGTVERYKQSLRFHWSDPAQCQFLNGRLEKYHVELLGLDPWVERAIDLPYDNTFLEDLYVQNLLPFTSYLLRVYTWNKGDLVSREPLDIKATTRGTRPLPPGSDQVQVKLISSSSVWLSWQPAYPPTGELHHFEVGQLEGPGGVLVSSVNVSLGHRCSQSDLARRAADYKETFCYVFNDLSPDTDYGFQVRVWNRGESQASDWSQPVSVSTASTTTTEEEEEMGEDGGSVEAETVSPGSSLSTTTVASSVKEPGQKKGHSDNTIILILCLTFGFIFLAVLVTALIYKLKIVRLKQQMRNEELWNQGRDFHNVSHSASYIGGSSVNTELSNMSGVSTYAVSMNTSFPSEIQSRRLPEPPPVRNRAELEPQYSEAYELDQLGQQAGSYLEMSPSRRGSRVLESTTIIQEEVTDNDGYLRPTFPTIDLTPIKLRPTEAHYEAQYLRPDGAEIAQESYEAPDLVRNVPAFAVPEARQPPVETGETGSNYNSLNFERLTEPRLSEHSQASSVRTSPSEPLIKSGRPVSLTVSTPVDV